MIKQNLVGVYGIEDVAIGNIYVGQSTDIAKRWSNHSAFLKNGEHNYVELQKAYNKDCNRIKYTILEECTEEMLTEREDWWIKHVQRVNGWNLINKQKFGGKHGTKVRDTTKMKAAQKGEKNGNCRLRKEDVIEIKKYLKKGVTQKELARQYNVSETHISNIANGKRWKNV
ncbi:GIY-YIG nuclease family protein [Clostridium tetani]|uniref:GIY-YIG nuclease family protein n=1 Tax=Clostridium tetani TaxID=1513 RepID=UPI0002F94BED|nr:GIY-YIG nuclease family protein [Clostridium tetani]SJZ50239.1 group I intron endonuclease [Clostridium tetani]